MIDDIIKLLDKYIAMDDDGRQWLTIEFNELEEKIRELHGVHDQIHELLQRK